MNSKKFLRRLHNNLGCEDCKNNKCKNNREILRECDQWYETIYEDLDRLEKLKEAIEILKKHFNYNELYGNEIDEEYLIAVYEYSEDINQIVSGVTRHITEEEYNLLKEVMGNE